MTANPLPLIALLLAALLCCCGCDAAWPLESRVNSHGEKLDDLIRRVEYLEDREWRQQCYIYDIQDRLEKLEKKQP